MPRPSGGTDRSDAYTGDKDLKKAYEYIKYGYA